MFYFQVRIGATHEAQNNSNLLKHETQMRIQRDLCVSKLPFVIEFYEFFRSLVMCSFFGLFFPFSVDIFDHRPVFPIAKFRICKIQREKTKKIECFTPLFPIYLIYIWAKMDSLILLPALRGNL